MKDETSMRALVLGVILVGSAACPSAPTDPIDSDSSTGSTTSSSSSTASPADSSTGATSTSSSGGQDSSTGPVTCDPPCDATEQCIDGMCMEPPPSSDYGPCDMCAAGETPVTIMGVTGCVCAPMCEGTGSPCPEPNEGTAESLCLLGVDPTMPDLCALDCTDGQQCPTGAICTDVGDGSICMHPR